MRSRWLWTSLAVCGAIGVACTTGRIGDGDVNGPNGTPTEAAIDGIGKMGMLRLTRKEYDATINDLLFEENNAGFKASTR